MHQRGGVDVVADQGLVEFGLADVMGVFLAERVIALVVQLAQSVQNPAKRALAGAITEKAVVVLEFDIETVNVDRRQPRSAVAGDARRGDDIFSHFYPCQSEFAGQRRGNPLVSLAGCRSVSGGKGAKMRQIRHIWPVFGPVFLDSALSRAISPANPARGFLALFVFARIQGIAPERAARKLNP